MRENLVNSKIQYKSPYGSSGSGSGPDSVSSVVEMASGVVGFWVVEEMIVVESLIVGESVVVSLFGIKELKKPITPTKMKTTNPNFMMSVKEQVSLL